MLRGSKSKGKRPDFPKMEMASEAFIFSKDTVAILLIIFKST